MAEYTETETAPRKSAKKALKLAIKVTVSVQNTFHDSYVKVSLFVIIYQDYIPRLKVLCRDAVQYTYAVFREAVNLTSTITF